MVTLRASGKKPYLLILSYILWPLQFNEEVLHLYVKPAGHPVPKQERHFDTLWNNCREQKEESFYVIICNKTIPAMAELPAAQRDCNSEGNTYRTFGRRSDCEVTQVISNRLRLCQYDDEPLLILLDLCDWKWPTQSLLKPWISGKQWAGMLL